MGELAGKVAIVTGGAFNIGRAITERLAQDGARVVVAARGRARIDETVSHVRDLGGEVVGVPTDVCDLAQVELLVERTISEFGGVDILAAIAGGGGAEAPIDVVAPEAWVDVVTRNLVGTFHCARAVLPYMREHGGCILTCAGGGAFFPLVGQHATAYASSKAAICRFTDQLQAELLDTGVRVNCIEPGPVAIGDIEAARRVADLAGFLAGPDGARLRGRILSAGEVWWRDSDCVAAVENDDAAYRLRRFSPEQRP